MFDIEAILSNYQIYWVGLSRILKFQRSLGGNTLDPYQIIPGGEGGERDLRNVVSGRDSEISWKKLQ